MTLPINVAVLVPTPVAGALVTVAIVKGPLVCAPRTPLSA